MRFKQLTYTMLAVLTMTVTACSDELTDELTGARAGQLSEQPFQWTRSADVATHASFIRNFGVGYSYNAVKGEFCNWKDIRCQVVDRKYCDHIEKTYGAKYYNYVPASTVNYFSEFRWSQRDYLANANMSFREEVDLGFYEGTRRKDQYIVENGVEESFYYQQREEQLLYDLQLDYNSLLTAASYDFPDLLTMSFRDAVNHLMLADPEDIAVVDSFVNVWGTHVIVEAFLGAKLDIELSNYVRRYKDVGHEHEITTEEFLGELEKKEDERRQDGFTWIEHGKLTINAKGGDQSLLTNLLGDYQYDGKATFSTDGIEKWRKSIHYDPDNELASNIEMTDMRVVPIWWFIEYLNEDVADRVHAAIEQDVEMQRKLLGEKNFFSVKFPISYPKATCEVQTESGEWTTLTRRDSGDDPQVVNIISGGRVVATVCKEICVDSTRVYSDSMLVKTDSLQYWVHDTIGHWERDTMNLWVAYPVYEGVVNQMCGVGVDEQKRVFDVKWLDGRRTLRRRKAYNGEDAVATGKYFYINLGQVDTDADNNVSYAPASAMAYYELSGGIQYDGNYRATPLPVTKEGADFIIRTDDPTLTNIVGFTYDADQNIYRRNSNYHYIYNPNEMRAVESKK